MEELFRTLDIKTIEYLDLYYIDNNGNCKTLKIEHPHEKGDA